MDIATWQIWLVIGLLLAAAELMGASFILVALGATALVIALVTALYPALGLTAQLLVFAGTGLVLVPAFVALFRRWHRSPASTMAGETVGDVGPELAVEASDERVGVRLHGDFFPAEAIDGAPLTTGERVRIREFAGITARVERLATHDPDTAWPKQETAQ